MSNSSERQQQQLLKEEKRERLKWKSGEREEGENKTKKKTFYALGLGEGVVCGREKTDQEAAPKERDSCS